MNTHSATQQRHFAAASRRLLAVFEELEEVKRLIDTTGQDTVGEDKIVAELEAVITLLTVVVIDDVEHGLRLVERSVEREGPLRPG